jgi:hypothetical protein
MGEAPSCCETRGEIPMIRRAWLGRSPESVHTSVGVLVEIIPPTTMPRKTKQKTAPAQQEIPADQAPVQSIEEAQAAAEGIGQVRGSDKKKRTAVRKRFKSAGIDLLMEAAELLGLVKTTWFSGETKSISVDMSKFNPEGMLPEDVGLFLGFRDSVETYVKVSTFVMCSSGYIGIHSHMKDRGKS